MKRREFIKSVLKTAAGLAIGSFVIVKEVLPRKFVRTVRLKKYPGTVKPLPGIYTTGKWRG